MLSEEELDAKYGDIIAELQRLRAEPATEEELEEARSLPPLPPVPRQKNETVAVFLQGRQKPTS